MEEELLNTVCSEYEANQVMTEMQNTIKEMEESEYYCNMLQQLVQTKNNTTSMLKDNILRILADNNNSSGRLQMVVYGLGSIQFNYRSQYQLSLAILLRRDFSHWIEGIIEIYDPNSTTPVDVKVMKKLGCKVLSNIKLTTAADESRPMLFFMPYAPLPIVKDLLLANWSPTRLNKIVIFTNSFHLATTADLEKLNIKTLENLNLDHNESRIEDNYCDNGNYIGCDNRRDDETMYLLKINMVHNTLLELDCEGCKVDHEYYCNAESLNRGIPCDVSVFKWPFSQLNWHFFNFSNLDHVHHLEAKLDEKMRIMRDRKEEKEQDADSYKVQDDDNHKQLFSCLKFLLREDELLASRMDNNPKEDWFHELYAQRYPSRPSKRIWCPPSTGWIKLNFTGVLVSTIDHVGNNFKDGDSDNDNDGGAAAAILGYGGIFYNEYGECLCTYSVPLLEEEEEEEDEGDDYEDEDEDEDDGDDDDDAVVVDLEFANAEALRKGLRLYMELRYSSSTKAKDRQKLVIEGDSVSIVRWVNGIFPPPKRLAQVFQEIHDLLSTIDDYVVFHIYKEANTVATELANKLGNHVT